MSIYNYKMLTPKILMSLNYKINHTCSVNTASHYIKRYTYHNDELASYTQHTKEERSVTKISQQQESLGIYQPTFLYTSF